MRGALAAVQHRMLCDPGLLWLCVWVQACVELLWLRVARA
jgi:hypothetical protein